MADPKNHHLVSRGYMKAWSVDGRRVLYIDKDQRQARLVGMKRIFVAPGLLTIRYEGITSAELEIAFGRVESHALPKVRGLWGAVVTVSSPPGGEGADCPPLCSEFDAGTSTRNIARRVCWEDAR